MINGVHHIALSTTDLERFLAFYCDLLGLPLISKSVVEPGILPAFEKIIGFENARVTIAQIMAGNIRFEIFCYEQPTPAGPEFKFPWDAGIRHLCFDVTDIDSEYQRLKAAGVTFMSAPQSVDVANLRSVYLRDPDNNIVELQEVFSGSSVDRAHITSIPTR